MTTTRTPHDIAQAAADYIEEHGWCQNCYHTPEGEVCLSEALGRITGSRSSGTEYIQTWNVLSDLVGSGVVFYNDAPGRTKADVLALLRSVPE